MGRDKSLIIYHGVPQRDYLVNLLTPLLAHTYLSCRADQALELAEFDLIVDKGESTGPMEALLSAFDKQPDAAWLVVACDMPHVVEETLAQLIQQRDTSKIATAFWNESEQIPEPLLAIWEPAANLLLRAAHQKGQRSPMRILQQNDVALLTPRDARWLLNVNA
jgi:molybdenum cofactor guanylyltransferase